MADPLGEKSFRFAIRIAAVSDHLQKDRREFVISRKVLDSGISIGLLIEEGRQGDDRVDMRKKYSLANKEAFETNYLLRILRDTKHVNPADAQSLISDCEELQRMLISAIKTLRASESPL